MPSIRVICVRWGDKYSADYVRILQSMFRRQLSVDHTFECVSARPIDGVVTVPEQCDFPGWWQKIGLFRPGFVTGPAIYCDLDVALVASVDWLADFSSCDLAAIENWGSKRNEGPLYTDEISSSTMVWSGNGATDEIFTRFSAADIRRLEPHGDQAYITEVMRGRVTHIDPARICSYKRHCRDHGGPPADASIVAFHGTPRPHEVADPWLRKFWRV